MDLKKVYSFNKQKKMRLYKYLPSEYLDSVVNEGAILFRNQTSFQKIEDEQVRGDELEGSILNKPDDGFGIKTFQGGR